MNPQELIEFWRKGPIVLPEKVDGFIGPRNVSELIREHLHYMKEQAKEESEKIQHIREGIRQGELFIMNNFYNAFKPGIADRVKRGEDSGTTIFALLPFVVDLGYDGAWSVMCQELPRETELVILGAALRQSPSGKFDPMAISEANKQLVQPKEKFYPYVHQLALYLDGKGVPLSRLTLQKKFPWVI